MPSTRRGLTAATIALLLGLAPPSWAQDAELPEEAARREALERARADYDDAMRLIEAYGRGATVRVSEAEARAADRYAARDRLAGRTADEPDDRAEPFYADAAREELEAYRTALRERLGLAETRAPEEVPDEDARAALSLRIIDVQDLVIAPDDHYAPSTGLGARSDGGGGGGGGGVLTFADEESDQMTTVGIDGDMLIELIESEVQTGDGESVEFSAGRLITRLRPASRERLSRLLAHLRRDRGGLVDLEVRVYRVTSALFSQLRAESNSLSDRAEALLKAGDGATLLASHRVMAHDGQRVHVFRGRSRSYVADIEVNQTGVLPVLNPEIAVINEGLVVEARPLVDRVRGTVLLDVALSLTRISEPVEVVSISDLEVELPVLQIARTTCTGAVPLGRGTLLGGTLDTGAEADDAVTCLVYVRPRLINASKTSKEGGR